MEQEPSQEQTREEEEGDNAATEEVNNDDQDPLKEKEGEEQVESPDDPASVPLPASSPEKDGEDVDGGGEGEDEEEEETEGGDGAAAVKKETFKWTTPADEFADDVGSDAEEEAGEFRDGGGAETATDGELISAEIDGERYEAHRTADGGIVIHLDCPLNRLLARTRKDKKRPLLQGDDREEVLRKLICERGPLYAEIADYRFVSDDQSVKVLVQQIVRQLRKDKVVE